MWSSISAAEMSTPLCGNFKRGVRSFSPHYHFVYVFPARPSPTTAEPRLILVRNTKIDIASVMKPKRKM